jgi:hypothetical protein
MVNVDLRGDIAALAMPIRKLLTLPSLTDLHFEFESARNINTLVDVILEGNEEAKAKVKMIKKDGRLVF